MSKTDTASGIWIIRGNNLNTTSLTINIFQALTVCPDNGKNGVFLEYFFDTELSGIIVCGTDFYRSGVLQRNTLSFKK